MEATNQLLSAASLLFGVMAVIYSLWWPEMTSAANLGLSSKREDNRKQIEKISQVIRLRAVPLLVAVVALFLIPLPTVFGILRTSLVGPRGPYDPIRASLVLLSLLTLALMIDCVGRLVALLKKKHLAANRGGD